MVLIFSVNIVVMTSCVEDLLEENIDDIVLEEQHEIIVEMGESITDIDGNVYPTVHIGEQRWTTENLKTTRYANGDTVHHVPDDEEWLSMALGAPHFDHGAWCYYNNEESNNADYGKLYNWHAAADERNLCPTGWRVPTDEDWHRLAKYLDVNAKIDSTWLGIIIRTNGIESEKAGGFLKSTGTLENGDGLWHSPNVGADNSTLFNATPSGGRMIIIASSGVYLDFIELNRGAAYWTSTERAIDAPPESAAHFRIVSFDTPYLEQRAVSKRSGFCVRCIKE